MRFARRFASVGAAVTLLDLGLVLLGARFTDWPLPVVDAVAIVVATFVSYWLHRAISYAAEPARRWYRDLRHYVMAALLALAADVAVFSILVQGSDHSVRSVVIPKFLGLAAGFLVRLTSYRQTMFRSIRADQNRPRGRQAAPGDVRLSLVIPAYFEEDGIAETVTAVEEALGHLRTDGGFELIVVDDGSTDATAERARAAGADRVIALEQNGGKGGAVRAGVLAARGRTIAFTDADLSYSPDQVLRLLAEIEGGWDVVVGSRKHTETRTLVTARRLREVGGRIVNAFTAFVLLGQYRDTQCGLKAFRSDVGKVIFSHSRIDGFAFDVEVFHLVERYRLTLAEVPVELTNSTRSTVHVVRDTTRLVRDLFRIRSVAHTGGYELEAEELATLGN
ncbi:MAG TPA: glycosyltransferase [Microthrixaceae bacterium]|nr:glycosyltransferase [Microthrixaceae bacterium]